MQTVSKEILQMLKSVFCVVILLAMTQAFSQGSPHTIEGSWTFNDTASFPKMNLEVKQHLDSLPQFKSQVLANYVGRIMTFNSDGTYVQAMTNGNSVNGTWSITPENMLLINDGSGNVLQQRILTINPSVLILAHPVLGDSRPLFKQTHFTKN